MTAFVPTRGVTGLLWLPSVVLLAGLVAVSLGLRQWVSPGEALLAVALAALAAMTPWLFLRRGLPWDPVMGGTVWLLCFLGAITVWRVSPGQLGAQLLWILFGFLCFLAVMHAPNVLDILRHYKYTWLVAGLALAIASLFVGQDITGTGAKLWVQLGPLNVQPSEVVRVLLVVFLAAYLEEKRDLLSAVWFRLGPVQVPPLPYLFPLLAMMGIAVLVLIFQRDLGPVLLYFGTFVAMVHIGTGRRSFLIAGVLLFLASGFIGYSISDHIRQRFDLWLNPWTDPLGAGFQSLQALGGLAFGGLFGRGPGYGYPTFIPAAHTDYPLAVIGEEWGLLGTLAVLLLYAVLVTRGLGLATRIGGDRFAQLLLAGLSASLAVQAFIILGGSLRVIPLSGITAPFLSYGGSSMVMGFIALGLMLRAWGEGAEVS